MGDDDGEALVREVLSENPAEKRGEREEWKRRQGWHRKEDVHARKDAALEEPEQQHSSTEERVGMRYVRLERLLSAVHGEWPQQGPCGWMPTCILAEVLESTMSSSMLASKCAVGLTAVDLQGPFEVT